MFGVRAKVGIAEVHGIGGGKENSVSILEDFEIAGDVSGRRTKYEYIDENRAGDHFCYYVDVTKN